MKSLNALILALVIPFFAWTQSALDTMNVAQLEQIVNQQIEQKEKNTTIVLYLLDQYTSGSKIDSLMSARKAKVEDKYEALLEERKSILPMLKLMISNLQIDMNITELRRRIFFLKQQQQK